MKKLLWCGLLCGCMFNYLSAQMPVAVSKVKSREVITLQVFMKITDSGKEVVTVELLPCLAYAGDTQIKPMPSVKYAVKKEEMTTFPSPDTGKRESISSVCFYRRFDTPASSSWLVINVHDGSKPGTLQVEMLYQPDSRQYGVVPFIGELDGEKYLEVYRFYTDAGKKLFLNDAPAATGAPTAAVVQDTQNTVGPTLKRSGLIPYRKGELWGFVSKNGAMVIPCEYPSIIMTHGDIHLIVGQGKYGFIKPTGEIVYPVGKCYSITKGRVPGGRCKIVVDMKDINELVDNYRGKLPPLQPSDRKMPIGFDPPAPAPSDNMKLYRENGRVGFKNDWGNVVIAVKYEDGGSFSEGMAAVELNGKWGFIGKSDKAVIPFKFNNAGRFSEGMAAVELNGKWGFINNSGRLVIPCRYSWVGDFHNGLALVEIGFMKQGYIDKTGKEYWED